MRTLEILPDNESSNTEVLKEKPNQEEVDTVFENMVAPIAELAGVAFLGTMQETSDTSEDQD